MQDVDMPVQSWADYVANCIEIEEAYADVEEPKVFDMSTMLLDGGTCTVMRDKPVYPISLLGYQCLQLVESGPPADYWESLEDGHDLLARVMESPVRMLTVNLVRHRNTQSRFYDGQVLGSEDIAYIFMCPDAPPQAVHSADVRYVQKDGPISSRGVNSLIIADVERAFGEDAVEFLSSEQSEQLIGALILSSKSFTEV